MRLSVQVLSANAWLPNLASVIWRTALVAKIVLTASAISSANAALASVRIFFNPKKEQNLCESNWPLRINLYFSEFDEQSSSPVLELELHISKSLEVVKWINYVAFFETVREVSKIFIIWKLNIFVEGSKIRVHPCMYDVIHVFYSIAGQNLRPIWKIEQLSISFGMLSLNKSKSKVMVSM